MFNLKQFLCSLLGKEYKTKVKVQPLNGQCAYSISCTGKKLSMEELLEDLKKRVLREIKDAALFNYSFITYVYPSWVCEDHKKALIEYLKELQYKVLYQNNDLILISWKVK